MLQRVDIRGVEAIRRGQGIHVDGDVRSDRAGARAHRLEATRHAAIQLVGAHSKRAEAAQRRGCGGRGDRCHAQQARRGGPCRPGTSASEPSQQAVKLHRGCAVSGEWDEALGRGSRGCRQGSGAEREG